MINGAIINMSYDQHVMNDIMIDIIIALRYTYTIININHSFIVAVMRYHSNDGVA